MILCSRFNVRTYANSEPIWRISMESLDTVTTAYVVTTWRNHSTYNTKVYNIVLDRQQLVFVHMGIHNVLCWRPRSIFYK